jgi:hypothetical protein
MATYYVRTDGNNANAGTGPGTSQAWQTLAKALGSTGIASGDTLWIAPGTYRESVTVNMTSATANTYIKGDPSASQFSGVTAGPIVWTSWTNNTTKPTTRACVLNGRDYLSFSKITFIGGDNDFGACIGAETQTSTNITLTECAFYSYYNNVRMECAFNTAFNWTFDRCVFHTQQNHIIAYGNRGTGSNYSLGITIKSCIFLQGNGIKFVQTGAGTAYPAGGITVTNCNFFPAGNACEVSLGTSTSSATVKNCIFSSTYTNLQAGISGEITEDYNLFVLAGTLRTNVTAGANSKLIMSGGDFGENWAQATRNIIPFYPRSGGSYIAAGTATGAPTTDFYGNSFAGTPSVGAVETGTISTSSGGMIVHPGMAGGMRG